MWVLRWLFDASDLREPLSVNPLLAVNPSRSQHNVFAEIWDFCWFDVGKFALKELKEAVSQHVLMGLLSVYDLSRTSVLTVHQSTSFRYQLLARRPHLH